MVPDRPASAVAQLPALAGAFLLVCVLAVVKWRGIEIEPASLLLVLMGVYALPNLVADFIRLPDVPAERMLRPGDRTLDRLVVKAAGLAAAFAAIAFAYALFPAYEGHTLTPMRNVLRHIAVPVAIAAPVYLWLTDARMTNPYDGCYMAGLCVLGRRRDADLELAWQFVLGWIVKGFFLPLMILFTTDSLRWFQNLDPAAAFGGNLAWFDTLVGTLYLVDGAVAAAGYMLTLKLFDTHIRSAEPTVGGWAAALLCYPPFWTIGQSYLKYEDGYYWAQWLADWPVLKAAWALAIILLVTVYAWASVSFGARFSNLTNRGVLTNGPYRWLKHPAYVCKNLSWWLISVPFVVTESAWQSFAHCLMLGGINLIYFARARTEERHMMKDPVYRAYAAWIAEHGLWARMKRLATPSAAAAGSPRL
jgi:protein-S-isoprenylcysteine O-methyltransferase Ste14